ncbi:hypothetical protein Verru16b_00166 [Lacunisphaera limnophila]|uniref:DUF5077 domain-containing protein n=1 Tax=Lacunisphaera limnophila TaxID=1838286 RepID=A0A1I7PHN6_9BACT|nr:DUF3472 domain-containing protein [Lacunisphaera limnophila]AOS43125.1 hypothetical protein Verru16b_00166 [Lacunisphaera limnophila]
MPAPAALPTPPATAARPPRARRLLAACLLCLPLLAANAASRRIPAHTAYISPNPEGAKVSAAGITDWKNPRLKVEWFGQINTPGSVDARVALRLADGQSSLLRLTVAGQSRDATAVGAGATLVFVDFGSFDLPESGYYRFSLESRNFLGKPAGDLDALHLDGPATAGAHFNIKERRNAASVHLSYPVSPGAEVTAFYGEVTGLEDPLWTFYMACGWQRGYLGMQVNSAMERRIIFSVWDSGNEAVNRSKVAAEDRVTLVAKGMGVTAGDFGNEGTGGHSHLKYRWKTGEKQRFLITARPADATHTIYSGYYFRPDQNAWMLISSWKAPKDGGYLRGLYSFSENFGAANGHVLRRARYGNQWIQTADGTWQELTVATFSHDETGKADRRDRFMGVENGEFFLSHGGFVEGFTEFGLPFERPATGQPPTDLPAAP